MTNLIDTMIYLLTKITEVRKHSLQLYNADLHMHYLYT